MVEKNSLDVQIISSSSGSEKYEVPFGSNKVRLSLCEWAIAFIIIIGLLYLLPFLWRRVEKIKFDPDYRIPYSLSDDYWMYNRYCRSASFQDKTLIIGDSVVWGHYVTKEQTLSHDLNELERDNRFVNMSIDGIHPAAMVGLIKYYGQAISGKNIILHCNLLWMSSKKHDLQIEEEFSFNHPKLVPQFFPKIPCYRQRYADRIAIVMGHKLSFYGWVDHLRIAYFGNMDMYSWTIEHPYENPLCAITLELPSPNEPPSPTPVAEPWTKKRIGEFNPSWVKLDKSFQWNSFKRVIEILESRGNRIFVLVGPFNEHMLTEEGLKTYNEMKIEVETWLEAKKIPHCVSSVLPSEYYADASHPLPDGYAMLAKQLFENKSFISFNSQCGTGSDGKNPL